MKKSTTFHPQIYGQTEVVNRTVIHLIHGYCNQHAKLWDEKSHYFQHVYNRKKHPKLWDENLRYIQHAYNLATLRHVWDTCLNLLWI